MTIKWHYLPNIVTFLRLIMVFPFLYCTFTEYYIIAFWIFVFAGISDGIDGYLARRFHWQSKIGAITDPLADKFLVISSYVSLTINHALPLWLTLLIISRDVVIVICTTWCAYYKKITFNPSYVSKVNTVFQLLLISCLLFQLSYPVLPPNLLPSLVILTTLTTVYSFVDYMIRGLYVVFVKKPA